MNERRCDLCEKEYICHKSAHIENYSLDGCYQFVPRTGERLSVANIDNSKQLNSTNVDTYDHTESKK